MMIGEVDYEESFSDNKVSIVYIIMYIVHQRRPLDKPLR
jgi:hypothetical protein